jgi:hypothetical protein
MTLEDRVQVQRLHVFRRAQEFGSVTTACREAGISRSGRSGAGLRPRRTPAFRGAAGRVASPCFPKAAISRFAPPAPGPAPAPPRRPVAAIPTGHLHSPPLIPAQVGPLFHLVPRASFGPESGVYSYV